jgi:hypothetical protein
MKWMMMVVALSASAWAQPASGPASLPSKAARVLPNHFVSGELLLPAVKTLRLEGKKGMADTTARVKIDAKGIIKIIEVTGPKRARLERSVATVNARPTVSVQVAPPAGERGKYGRAFERDHPFFGPALREYLAHSHGLRVE